MPYSRSEASPHFKNRPLFHPSTQKCIRASSLIDIIRRFDDQQRVQGKVRV